MSPGLVRQRDDHVGGSGPVDKFVEAIESAENRERVGAGMDSQMTTTQSRLRRHMVACIDEANERDARPALAFQPLEQLPSVSACAHQENPVARRSSNCLGSILRRDFQRVFHELPPIHR
jgi:hypothetical protein